MKKIGFTCVVCLLILIVTGCATTFTSQNGKLAYGEVEGSEVGEVVGKERAMYIIHPALISLNAPNESLETVIEPAMDKAGATAVKDITISYEFDFLSLLASYVGFGMPMVRVEGTGVK